MVPVVAIVEGRTGSDCGAGTGVTLHVVVDKASNGRAILRSSRLSPPSVVGEIAVVIQAVQAGGWLDFNSPRVIMCPYLLFLTLRIAETGVSIVGARRADRLLAVAASLSFPAGQASGGV